MIVFKMLIHYSQLFNMLSIYAPAHRAIYRPFEIISFQSFKTRALFFSKGDALGNLLKSRAYCTRL